MTETRPSWLLPPVDSLTEFPTEQIARQLSRICRYQPGQQAAATSSRRRKRK